MDDTLKSITSMVQAKAYVREHGWRVTHVSDLTRTAVVWAVEVNKHVWWAYGFTECGKQDKFDGERGKQIAEGRAVAELAKRMLQNRQPVVDRFIWTPSHLTKVKEWLE